METSITKYLTPKKDHVLVQAQITKDLEKRLLPFKKKQRTTWSKIIRACLERLADEVKQ